MRAGRCKVETLGTGYKQGVGGEISQSRAWAMCWDGHGVHAHSTDGLAVSYSSKQAKRTSLPATSVIHAPPITTSAPHLLTFLH